MICNMYDAMPILSFCVLPTNIIKNLSTIFITIKIKKNTSNDYFDARATISVLLFPVGRVLPSSRALFTC